MTKDIKNTIWSCLAAADYEGNQLARTAYNYFEIDPGTGYVITVTEPGLKHRAIIPRQGRPQLLDTELAKTDKRQLAEFLNRIVENTTLVFETPESFDKFIDDVKAVFPSNEAPKFRPGCIELQLFSDEAEWVAMSGWKRTELFLHGYHGEAGAHVKRWMAAVDKLLALCKPRRLHLHFCLLWRDYEGVWATTKTLRKSDVKWDLYAGTDALCGYPSEDIPRQLTLTWGAVQGRRLAWQDTLGQNEIEYLLEICCLGVRGRHLPLYADTTGGPPA